jgi:DNA/RNA endonuclease YhcR with UshA esterase domain
MSRSALASVLGFALFVTTLPTQAHHSFSATFDAQKPLKVTGTVTSVEWQNPHSWFYLDVKDDAGAVTSWAFELASPNLLLRNGWTRTTLEAGDVVTVEGFLAHDQSNTGNARVIVLASTGQRLLGGSSQGSTP